MTWLDLGNSWRNLYLLSCMLAAFGLGVLFAVHGLFTGRSRTACFLTGVAATPFVQYLWTLLLALVWPRASKWVYIGGLPLLAGLYLAGAFLRNLRRLPTLLRQGLGFARRLLQLDKPALVCLCFALCVVILLAPVCIRFCSSMNSLTLSGDSGEYMALAERYCNDRSLPNLLEKEELEGRFRGNSHFPSLELYMSYGLFHSPESFGYPFDKPAVSGLGMLTLYAAAAYMALLLVVCRGKKPCILLGVVLLNLIPNLYHSVAGAPRDLWRILALLLAAVFFAGLQARQSGFLRNLGKAAAALAVCFTVMSAHVVCFVQLPFLVVAWVIWQWLGSLYRSEGQAGRVLLRSVGIASGGAAGTLAAFSGNIWCYLRWGQMNPWRLMTTFTDAPWYRQYLLQDYRIVETTTQLSFFADMDSILYGYASPLGPAGFWTALLTLLCVVAALVVRRSRVHARVQAVRAAQPKDGPVAVLIRTDNRNNEAVEAVSYAALIALGLLAPMTGLLDSRLYSFSGTFAMMPRYSLQWFFVAAAALCAALAALADLLPGAARWLAERIPERLGCIRRHRESLCAMLRALPLWLCAALCVLGFVQGTRQTGYANSFYRSSRHVMESESLLLDNGFREKFALLMALADEVGEEEMILIPRTGYQYPLHGRGHVLDANPIVPVMDLSLEEVPAELERMKVAMLATESDFWDQRYYPASTLAEYLETLPEAQRIEYGGMRYYLLKPELAEAAARWMADHPAGEE
ncbi:MAG: hypothetical protein E7320_04400 [Clostridiales bacterium]|nr:hypothetical protein [Clostridiales bacterium]